TFAVAPAACIPTACSSISSMARPSSSATRSIRVTRRGGRAFIPSCGIVMMDFRLATIDGAGRAHFKLAAAILLFCLSGCGSSAYELATVHGRVLSCEGQPAAGGMVTFQPLDNADETGRKKGNAGRPARGTVGDDGTFTLKTIGIEEKPGAVTGRHSVKFKMPPTKKPALTAEDRAGMSPEEIKKWEAEFATRPAY